MRRVLTVGVTYTAEKSEGVEIENLGLCQPSVDQERAAFPLHEYDTIIINPQSYSHFLFGMEGEFSNDPDELGKLKRQNDKYDIDAAFFAQDREKEIKAAITAGATVVWCLSEPKRMNFQLSRDPSGLRGAEGCCASGCPFSTKRASCRSF